MFIESVHLNVYSIEELCYFLSSNLALADEAAADEKLPAWLSKECGIEGAEKEFERTASQDKRASALLMWIFAKSHYFSENELRALRAKTEALEAMPEVERQKKRGDALVKYGKFKRGISCYESVLSMDAGDEIPASFKACVCYNIGVAYEKMFQSGKALEYFRKAYENVNTTEYLTAYLSAAYFDGGKEEMTLEAKKLGVKDSVVSAVAARLENIRPYEKPADPDKALDEWIRAYHISVDQ